YLQGYVLSYWFYPLSCLIIATRQHALGVLSHDAVHYSLLRNKQWNDFVGDWLLAFPLFISIYGYRRQHFAHHRYTSLKNDPDRVRMQHGHYAEVKSVPALFLKLLKFAGGFYALRDTFEAVYQYQLGAGLPVRVQGSRIAFWAVVGGLLYHFQL